MMFDVKLMQPACVIVQAAFGCSAANHFLQMHFDNWISYPTPDMRKIRGTRAQWEKLAAKLQEKK